MIQPFQIAKTPLLLITFLGVLFSTPFAYSAEYNLWNKGYRSNPSAATRIDLTTKHGDCIKVESVNPDESFISTKSLSGWTSFKSNIPSGLTYSPCIPGEWIYTLGRAFYSGNGDRDYAFIHGQSYMRDSAGNFYFFRMDGGLQIKKYSASGSWIMTLGNGDYAEENNLSGTAAILIGGYSYHDVGYAAVDEDQNIYLTNGTKIKKYSSTGSYISTLGSNTVGDNNLSGISARFRDIQGLAVVENNVIAVADQKGRRIKLYDSVGNWITTIGNRYWDNQLSGMEAGIDTYLNYQYKPFITTLGQIYIPAGSLE